MNETRHGKLEPSAMIGDGILGLITVGMYGDPLAMYREYLQNSADALSACGYAERGKVEITIEPSQSRVRIRDNGPGLSHEAAIAELLPIARSNKRTGRDRGFRGIGRLSGLAFADTVTFTTRAHEGRPITRISWEGRRFRDAANSHSRIEDSIRDSVEIQTLDGQSYPDHFFEVEVDGVARHAAGKILNREAVRAYIGEVCPVPFSNSFPYAREVDELFASLSIPLTMEVTFQGDRGPIHRVHGDTIRFSANREDSFTDFEEIHIPAADGDGEAAIGWVAHSSYLGAIPRENRIRGLRARLGNIQIGDEAIFDGLLAEERFNRWCVGEIHILDRRLVPNSRRDYFEPGPHLRNLENQLGPVLRDISARCRKASSDRHRDRRILSLLCNIEDSYELAKSGYLAADDAKRLVQEAWCDLLAIRERMCTTQWEASYARRLEAVEYELRNFKVAEEQLSCGGISASDVGTYQRVFRALATVSSSPRSAKEMIEAVLAQA